MVNTLQQGREWYRRRAWVDAYTSLSLADRTCPLSVEDLELLWTSAYLIGRDLESERILERAHHAHVVAGDQVRAARAAFWLGLSVLLRGEIGPATGWLARARRLLDSRDCAEQGYLLLPAAEQCFTEGHIEGALGAANRAAAIGDRFGDADLLACARHLQGRALLKQGQIKSGLALLDEAMLAVTAGELSPIITGLIYCSVIEACQQVYALSRAREWTAALSRWCEQQPGMVAFRGTCLVRRAACVRMLMGVACRSLGDEETAGLEFGAARTAFQQLGAAPDLARLDTFENREASTHRAQLTTRELQVLRLVAAGKTNKAIATELSLSERTIDRHVGNILTKLDVPSRAGAAAYACRHKLL